MDVPYFAKKQNTEIENRRKGYFGGWRNMPLDPLPPLHGEGQTAKRSGWGSQRPCVTAKIVVASDSPARPTLCVGHPPRWGEGDYPTVRSSQAFRSRTTSARLVS